MSVPDCASTMIVVEIDEDILPVIPQVGYTVGPRSQCRPSIAWVRIGPSLVQPEVAPGRSAPKWTSRAS